MSRRDRVSEAIRQEVSVIVHDKLKDPRLGFVTIARVELTADLRRALIFFSVLGNDQDYKKTKNALDSALGFIRSLVAKSINLRFAPEIVFKEDRSTEYSVRIQEVLEEIKELDKPKPSSVALAGIKMEPARAKVRGSQGPKKLDTKAAFIPALKGGVFERRSIKKEQRSGSKKSRRLHKKT